MAITGIITKGIGGFYYVDTGTEVYECRARGKLRLQKSAPLAGDRVLIETAADKTGYIMDILPRKNALVRPAVSNIDQLFIIASKADPVTDLFLIDKVSVIAAHNKIPVILVLNKNDLDPADEYSRIYEDSGFCVIRTNALTGEGIDRIAEKLPGKLSVFTGNSGVGKSSLINRLCPGLSIETGKLSEKIGRGCHTTRKVELVKLYPDTFVADTPGFSSFELLQMEKLTKEDLENAFPEFSSYLGSCRFHGCSHVGEKECAVKEALNSGAICKSRYESYVRLYDVVKNSKEWEK